MNTSRLPAALPFWISLALIPLAVFGTVTGGWALALLPLSAWYVLALVDAALGPTDAGADPLTPEAQMRWHRMILLIWPVAQGLTLFGLIAHVTQSGHLSGTEQFWAFFGIGILSGTVGIVYAHELLHQRSRLERGAGDLLLAMALYGHFRSEHLLVHHVHVGTPRDAVTARYNEGFHRYFARVLPGCFASALRAEAAMLARRGRSGWHLSNPFWRYGALQAGLLVLAYMVGGWHGVALFAVQAFVAIWQLELVNYVEHYGLVRKYLGAGKYEPVQPHHSWNAMQKASNWLLINLQRHSDHHAKPARRYPLLQAYPEDQAPILPAGYPVMTALAMVPPLWRRVMNPRVRAWRKRHYPEIRDWKPYSRGEVPKEAAEDIGTVSA